MPTEDYYDIQEFAEGYTGYDGSEVWNFIHNRICFSPNEGGWKADFNKAVSGLHAMISAQIIRAMRERIEAGEEFTADEKWRDPVAEFNRRLSPQGETPLAIENMYFLSMLLLRAVALSKDRILDDQRAGCMDDLSNQAIEGLFEAPLLSDANAAHVSVATQQLSDHATQDQASLWQARMRTRELLRIMNCVQCNKCRLHGKIAVMGVSTALQILVGENGQGKDPRQVQRVEIATLLTALDKCSRGIDLCLQMQA